MTIGDLDRERILFTLKIPKGGAKNFGRGSGRGREATAMPGLAGWSGGRGLLTRCSATVVSMSERGGGGEDRRRRLGRGDSRGPGLEMGTRGKLWGKGILSILKKQLDFTSCGFRPQQPQGRNQAEGKLFRICFI